MGFRMGEQIGVEHLFHKSWVKPLGLSTLLLILYFPLGLLLFVVRTFIFLQFLLLGYLLPPSEFRLKCIRVISTVLGITVSSSGEPSETPGKVFIANHATSYDHFAIHLVTGVLLPVKNRISQFITLPFALLDNVEVSSSTTKPQIDSILQKHEIMLYPEGTTTSGEIGLLSFSSFSLPDGVPVQPVAIHVNRPLLNSTAIGSSLTQELLLLIFAPFTHFHLKFLPSFVTSAEQDWKTQTQSAIAKTLSIHHTKFLAADKAEYAKKLFFKPPSIAVMAREVQKKLGPISVSPEMVIATLQQTGSVDAAVESLKLSASSLSCNAAPTFSKSATQRMSSFQERKKVMIALAREKYIARNNLTID